MLAWRAADRRCQSRRARRRQFLAQQGEDAATGGERGCLVFAIGAIDDEHELAALLVGIGEHARMQGFEGRAKHGLEALGELARKHGFALRTENRDHVGQCLDDAMTRFVEDQRARLVGEHTQALAACRCLGWKKTLEHETIAGQTRHRQCGDCRTRAGHRRDLTGRFARRAHQTKARIADERSAGIRNQGDFLAGKQARNDALRLFTLVVFVQGKQWRMRAKLGQQRRTVARVLGGNQCNACKHFFRARREIAEIADRRGHHPQASWSGIHVAISTPGTGPRSAIIAAIATRANGEAMIDIQHTSQPGPTRLRSILRRLCMIALALGIAACTPAGDSNVRPEVDTAAAHAEAAQADQLFAQGRLDEAAAAYRQLADSERGAVADHYRLRAAETLRDNGEIEAVATELEDIRRRRLRGEDLARFDLLQVEIALHRRDPARAEALLDAIDAEASPALHMRVLELRARSQLARGDAFTAAHTRAQLDRDLQGLDRDHNRKELLATLATINVQTLRDRFAALAPDDPLRPWIEQAMRKQGQALPRTLPQPSRQIGTIDANAGGNSRAEGYHPPQRVALLLPLSAQFASVAASIRDGFMTAWSAEAVERRPQLRIYDSGKTPQDAIAAYRKAVAEGADRVVGPLLREAVGALFHEVLEVPVLALNHPDTGEVPPPGSSEYGLLPETEGAQVAERMLARGITRSAIIGAQADWSERAARAFRAQFEAGGGVIVGQVQLGDKDINYAKSIAQATASLGEGSEAGVFISVRPQQGRLLVPQLRAARIKAALFATSHIYAGDANAMLDRDLDGVEFCDAPWLFGPIAGRPDRSLVGPQIDSANGAGGRLFAFGMDAYALLPYLDWLGAHPDAYLNGATGQLTVDRFGRVHRLVDWARFDNGLAMPVVGALESTPVPAQ